MPFLELLRLGISVTDSTLILNLSTVHSLVDTNSLFYHYIEDPSLISTSSAIEPCLPLKKAPAWPQSNSESTK